MPIITKPRRKMKMQKPNDYDSAPVYGESRPLEVGGHIMKIVKVEESTSKNGNPMILIYLDTDKSDKQPQYFKQRYDNDSRQDKKWPCIVYQVTEDESGCTKPMFKTFIESVTKSNSSSFKVLWGDKFCECFKGRLVGGVFRREQFRSPKTGKLAWSVKCCAFRSVAAINEGIDPPADKYLEEDGGYPMPPESNVRTDTTPTDDDYPF